MKSDQYEIINEYSGVEDLITNFKVYILRGLGF